MMDRIIKQMKKYTAICGSILGLSAVLFFSTTNVDARTGGPESLLAPEYDVWCEGPAVNCGGDIIVTPDNE